MRWIGFSGKMGAGKDHAFNYLRNGRYHQGWTRVSFADQLRQEIYATLGHQIEKPYTNLERRLQQWWGTDYRRAQDPDYWVKKAEEEALELTEAGKAPVFTDVRFPNEADMIRAHEGLVVRLEASVETRARRLGFEPPDHESETALDGYDFDFVVNSEESGPRYSVQMGVVIAAAEADIPDWLRAAYENR